jgi:hypothetical protein
MALTAEKEGKARENAAAAAAAADLAARRAPRLDYERVWKGVYEAEEAIAAEEVAAAVARGTVDR